MKNLGRGGKGFKKSKKGATGAKRELALKQDGLDYATVTQMLGNGRAYVVCHSDGVSRLGHIRGSIYKRQWIVKDDLVLVSFREFEDTKCDIILKYTQDEVKSLVQKGEIRATGENEGEQDVVFEEEQGPDLQNNADSFDIDDI
jgi:translation initiation factor 1A